MIMEARCPYCKSEDIRYGSFDEEGAGADTIKNWRDCQCSNKHHFIISEVHTITSRIVAKDDNELEELIKKELNEERE